jgi:hypothetical protein
MIGIPLPVKKGVRLAAIWESDDFYRGRPSSREALRRLALWGYVVRWPNALGGGTEPSHLLQNKFYQLIRFVSMQLMHTMKVMMGVIFQGGG